MGRGMGRGMMGYGYTQPPRTDSGMWRLVPMRGAVNPISQNPQGSRQTRIIAGYGFAPQVITVKAGTTVTWTNYDTVAHSIDQGHPLGSDELLELGRPSTGAELQL
jgi:hypothetical protein